MNTQITDVIQQLTTINDILDKIVRKKDLSLDPSKNSYDNDVITMMAELTRMQNAVDIIMAKLLHISVVYGDD